MARELTGTGHHVRISSPTVYPAGTGTVAIRIRPNWNHNDGVDHKLWWHAGSNSADPDRLQFQKFSDNNVYIGWYNSGDNDRIAYAATSTDFTNGTWQSHVFTWSDSADTQEYFTGGVSRATRSTSLVTYTVSNEQTIGNTNSGGTANNANAAFADYALWDVILTAGEIAAYDKGVDPRTIRPGSLVRFAPLLGNDSTEPDLVAGQGWTVTSAAKAAHPRVFRPHRRNTTVGTAAAGGSTGTVAYTNANDTSAASGTTTVTGTLARTNANDTSAASGTTTIVGTLARTNENDTSAASGTTTVVGTLATTNADDTCAASGSVGSSGSTGTVAYTNANDTSAAAGTTTVVGTSARTNANDSVSAAGWVGTITGTLAYTNANDTVSASGSGGTAVATPSSGAGRSRRRHRYVVEIDGEEIAVDTPEQAEALLETAREAAQELADQAIQRAAQAKSRPVRKVMRDARAALVVPKVQVPEELEPVADKFVEDIEALYASAMRTIEVAAMLNKRQRQEEDDEDVLLLLA